MKVDLHGRKIIGLKAASGKTDDYGYYSGYYNEVFYNRDTGKVWTIFQYSFGFNTWSEYHDPAIIKICNTAMHMTMQEIADAIDCALTEIAKIAEIERAEGL